MVVCLIVNFSFIYAHIKVAPLSQHSCWAETLIDGILKLVAPFFVAFVCRLSRFSSSCPRCPTSLSTHFCVSHSHSFNSLYLESTRSTTRALLFYELSFYSWLDSHPITLGSKISTSVASGPTSHPLLRHHFLLATAVVPPQLLQALQLLTAFHLVNLRASLHRVLQVPPRTAPSLFLLALGLLLLSILEDSAQHLLATLSPI